MTTTNNPDLDPTDPYGVRCMLATGFAFYWEYRLTGDNTKRLSAAGCVENALHRWFMPAEWDNCISMERVNANLDAIMDATPAALDVFDHDRKPDLAWEDITVMCQPDCPDRPPVEHEPQPEWVNRMKPHLGRAMRHWWLMRLHERNHRYDPRFDRDNIILELNAAAQAAGRHMNPNPPDETIEAIIRDIPRFVDPKSTTVTWDRLLTDMGTNDTDKAA